MRPPENEFSGVSLTHEGYFDSNGTMRSCSVLRIKVGNTWKIVMSWEEVGRPTTLEDASQRMMDIIRQAYEVAEMRGPIGPLRKAIGGVFLPEGG